MKYYIIHNKAVFSKSWWNILSTTELRYQNHLWNILSATSCVIKIIMKYITYNSATLSKSLSNIEYTTKQCYQNYFETYYLRQLRYQTHYEINNLQQSYVIKITMKYFIIYNSAKLSKSLWTMLSPANLYCHKHY